MTTSDAVMAPAPPIIVPWRTRLAMFGRLLAIQGSWNYELLLGNGVGFCVEPALRLLPGGRDGAAYQAAIARQSQYFNSHPYLAALAVGALAHAELAGESPARLERFRAALCGPCGSVGDRLVWAGWLPACSLVALALFGLGLPTWMVVAAFLVLYNLGHLALRAWALHAGLERGLRVASALGQPWLRRAPERVGSATAFLAGLALPLVLDRLLGFDKSSVLAVLVAVGLGGYLLTRVHGRIEGWRLALVALAGFVLFSVAVR
ncbi:MAG TPA: PTS system mannose/fructose/sorbose family transporter subunit IID [Gemmatimonadaceae bacterium]|jgi:PTS system mannose-specific IID component|nr:PTS system mannose/fructose/sorbose family transporter subunit IID [Gemmatimonadaceae bacterium]